VGQSGGLEPPWAVSPFHCRIGFQPLPVRQKFGGLIVSGAPFKQGNRINILFLLAFKSIAHGFSVVPRTAQTKTIGEHEVPELGRRCTGNSMS